MNDASRQKRQSVSAHHQSDAAHSTYIETHLGGGVVFRNKRPADRLIGIDMDERVVDRWRSLALPSFEIVHNCAVQLLSRFDFGGGELV